MKRIPGFITVIILLAALSIGVVVFWQRNLSDRGFPHAVAVCHAVDKRLRFSCYRAAIEGHFAGNPAALTEAVKTLPLTGSQATVSDEKDPSYAIFGTNCHTFYHAMGDFLAEKNPQASVSSLLANCPTGCTSGCTMGLFKRSSLLHGFSDAHIASLFPSCRAGEEHQCSHEIGHILHDKYFSSILRVLDQESQKNYHVTPNPANRYTVGNSVNMNAPFEDCKKYVPAKERAYCLTGVGHNMFLFAQFSEGGYQTLFDDCKSVAPENRDDCYAFLIYRIGINEAAPRFLTGKADEGRKICDDAVALISRTDLAKHCYLGIGGGIGLFVDTEFGSRKITDEMIPEVKKQLLEHAKLCDLSGENNRNSCLAGIWGTRYKILYKLLYVTYDPLDTLIPTLDDDFEIVG